MIGVLGGTFDPVHEGHLQLARAAYDALDLEKLILVPAYRNPLKGQSQATPAQRVRMLQIAASGESRKFEISELEIHRPGPSFTIDTLTELQRQQPGDYCLLLGHEVFADFAAWKNPGGILALADLVVIRRPGTELTPVDPILSSLPGLAPIQRTAPNQWTHARGKRVTDLSLPLWEVSSTALRAALRALPEAAWNEPEPPVLGIQRGVWLFIKEFRLYTVK